MVVPDAHCKYGLGSDGSKVKLYWLIFNSQLNLGAHMVALDHQSQLSVLVVIVNVGNYPPPSPLPMKINLWRPPIDQTEGKKRVDYCVVKSLFSYSFASQLGESQEPRGSLSCLITYIAVFDIKLYCAAGY